MDHGSSVHCAGFGIAAIGSLAVGRPRVPLIALGPIVSAGVVRAGRSQRAASKPRAERSGLG